MKENLIVIKPAPELSNIEDAIEYLLDCYFNINSNPYTIGNLN